MATANGAYASKAEGLPPATEMASSIKRVLIADDHQLVRDGLRSVLAVIFDAAEFFEAASVDEALAILERVPDMDLVMLDVRMPGATGISGLQALRERVPGLPVVMISGTADRALIGATLSAGAMGFIPKSHKRSAIVSALNQILSGSIYVPDDFDTDDERTCAEQAFLVRIEQLTPQQRVVLGLVVEGRLNKQIAHELDLSIITVKQHVSAVLAKLGVSSRTQAAVLANRAGFQAERPVRH